MGEGWSEGIGNGTNSASRFKIMQTVKDQVKEMLDVLPEDTTYDDIHYHLFVREKIDKGIADIEQGKIVTEAEMDARFKQWLEK